MHADTADEITPVDLDWAYIDSPHIIGRIHLTGVNGVSAKSFEPIFHELPSPRFLGILFTSIGNSSLLHVICISPEDCTQHMVSFERLLKINLSTGNQPGSLLFKAYDNLRGYGLKDILEMVDFACNSLHDYLEEFDGSDKAAQRFLSKLVTACDVASHELPAWLRASGFKPVKLESTKKSAFPERKLRPMVEPGERLAALTRKMSPNDPIFPSCWIFGGTTDNYGYGVIPLRQGEKIRAHRLAWELWGDGQVPTFIGHICGLKSCVNPSHMIQSPNNGMMAEKAALRLQELVDMGEMPIEHARRLLANMRKHKQCNKLELHEGMQWRR